jgi:hypothetical protein
MTLKSLISAVVAAFSLSATPSFAEEEKGHKVHYYSDSIAACTKDGAYIQLRFETDFLSDIDHLESLDESWKDIAYIARTIREDLTPEFAKVVNALTLDDIGSNLFMDHYFFTKLLPKADNSLREALTAFDNTMTFEGEGVMNHTATFYINDALECVPQLS